MNSLKSIATRYASIQKKGFEDPKELNKITVALQKSGINAQESNGQLRNFADVMDELGKKWGDLDGNTKKYISTQVAGLYQANRFQALMNDYGTSMTYYDKALNAAGSSQQKMAIYQESINAKIDKFKASVEGLWQGFINSDVLKFMIDLGTNIVNLISGLNGASVIIAGVAIAIKVLGTSFVTTALQSAGLLAAEQTLIASTVSLGAAATVTGKALQAMVAKNAVLLAIAASVMIIGKAYEWNVDQAKALKKETDDLTKSTQSLIDSYSGGKTTKESLAGYDDVIAKEKELLSLKERENMLMAEQQANPYQDYSMALNEVRNKMKEVKGSFAAAGIVIDENTNQIDRNSQAGANLSIVAQENKNKISDLVEQYYRLSAIENKGSSDKAKLKSTISQLKDNIDGLKVSIDKEGNSYIVNNELINKSVQLRDIETGAILDLTNMDRESAAKRIAINSGLNKYTLESAKARILAINQELKAYAQLGAASGVGFFKAGKGLLEKGDLEASIGEIEKLLGTLPNAPTPGSPDTGSKDKKDKDKAEKVDDLKTRYIELERTIEGVNTKLEENQRKLDIADDKDKIALLIERRSLYNELADKQSQLVLKKKAESAEIQKKLKALGFISSIEESTGEIIIKNLSRENKLKGDTKKKAQDLINATVTYNGELRESVSNQSESLSLVEKTKKEQEKITAELAKQAAERTKEIEDMLTELDNKQREAEIAGYENQIDALDKAFDTFKTNKEAEIQIIQDKIDALDLENENAEKANELAEKQLAISEQQQIINRQEEILARAKSQRNVRYFNKDTGIFEWIADPNKVKEEGDKLLEEKTKLSELNKELEDFNRQEKLRLDKLALEKEIEYKNKEIQAEEKRVNAQKAILQSYIDSRQTMIDTANNNEQQKYIDFWNSLTDEEKKMYEGRLGNLKAFIAEYLALQAKLKAEAAAAQSVSSAVNNVVSSGGSASSLADLSKAATLQPGVTTKVNADGTITQTQNGVTTTVGSFNPSSSAVTVNKPTTPSLSGVVGGKVTQLQGPVAPASSTKKGKSMGGITTYTGLEMLHGSPNAPEVTFNANDASKLYNIVRGLPKTNPVNNSTTNNSGNTIVHIGNISLPDVKDANGLVNGIRNIRLVNK